MLVFDTETRTDPTQKITFGGYRYVIDGQCIEEGLFHADNILSHEMKTLRQYVARHKPFRAANDTAELKLLSVREFLDELLFKDGYKARASW